MVDKNILYSGDESGSVTATSFEPPVIIFHAMYCDCVHESSFATISVHKTRAGAEAAIINHKEELIINNARMSEEYQRENPDRDPKYCTFKIEDWEAWDIKETVLLE